MNDLIKLLRGRRIDGRSADEIMRLAADEIESLRSRLAEAERDAARYRWLRQDQPYVYASLGYGRVVGEALDHTIDKAMEGGE